ncbi:glycosyltransferase [Siminovitchia sediminis]|uniref:Glycosyltransferase n=1 Tax=Siminovitchia sediminis TaxID=1274353 RepID=A0ABW4KGS5_9BACI
MRVLFLPFLQIPSGHHHVADCIQTQLEQIHKDCHCEKVDIFSYSYGKIENWASSLYLQWIHRFPRLYSSIYRTAAVKEMKRNKRFYMYELLFLHFIKDLLKEKNPDVVICTHALPSYMLVRLKKLNMWSGLLINAYTDYFINNLWGMEGVDYHFVPSKKVKDHLIKQGIKAQSIFITGIPVHPLFKSQHEKVIKDQLYTALISGGNMGAGSISKLLERLHPAGKIRYKVLCGKNHRLYQYMKDFNHPLVQPLPFISSKGKMNHLYNETDLIITKPGGVTISESLVKKLPIFIYDVLPGQEEQNLQFLKNKGLVYHLDGWKVQENVEEEIWNILHHQKHNMTHAIQQYLEEIELEDPASLIIEKIKSGR